MELVAGLEEGTAQSFSVVDLLEGVDRGSTVPGGGTFAIEHREGKIVRMCVCVQLQKFLWIHVFFILHALQCRKF